MARRREVLGVEVWSKTNIQWLVGSELGSDAAAGELRLMRMGEIGELQDRLRKFRDERNWAKFHDPKSLACALGAEVGELLELLMWLSPTDLEKLEAGTVESIRHELADIALYTVNLANAMEIDLSEAINEKIEINARRIPPAADAPPRKADAL